MFSEHLEGNLLKDSEAGPEPQTMNDILSRCTELLRRSMPDDWSTFVMSDRAPFGNPALDAQLGIRSPDGAEVLLVVETKRILERRDISGVAEQLNSVTRFLPNARGIVAARYLAPSVRETLVKNGLSYVDVTGNIRVTASAPGIFIACTGADKDPWRGPGRPRGTLKGAPAAKIVRALVDFQGKPWTIRDLIEVSGVSTGATYRVVEHLERETLIERTETGKIVARNWRPLLEAWSKDYGFVRSSNVTRWIEPRGLSALLSKASESREFKYSVTGTIAAAEWAAYAPARSALIYVEDADRAAKQWGLRSSDVGTNVLLAEPESDVVFQRTLTTVDGIVIASPAQVVVDLMTGPGRNPAEAEELMDWMERNESWRR